VEVGVQRAVAARIPGSAALGLVPPAGADQVPAARLADPAWVAAVVRRRGGDPRVAATVWWYSASAVLLAPPLAGLVAGRPLSARLADTALWLSPAGLPVAAVSSAPAGDLGAELRGSLAAVVGAVADAGGVRPRPLWAIATDSLANGLLGLGRAVGDVAGATALAARVAAAVGPPLPAPRYEDVAGTRFTRRASCCLVDRLPGGSLCTSCPRRPPGERRSLLEAVAARS
jgi:ferric iron reductase protein FhuF